MNFSRINLVVGNIEKAQKFYSEKLGLRVKYARENGLVGIDLGATELVLIPKEKASGRPAGEFSFCFELPDTQQLENRVKEFKGRGLNPVVAPERNEFGEMIVLYAGTDNERVELVAPFSQTLEDKESYSGRDQEI